MKEKAKALTERWQGPEPGLSDGRPSFQDSGSAPIPEGSRVQARVPTEEQPKTWEQRLQAAGKIATQVVDNVTQDLINTAAKEGGISEDVKKNLDFLKKKHGPRMVKEAAKVYEDARTKLGSPQ